MDEFFIWRVVFLVFVHSNKALARHTGICRLYSYYRILDRDLSHADDRDRDLSDADDLDRDLSDADDLDHDLFDAYALDRGLSDAYKDAHYATHGPARAPPGCRPTTPQSSTPPRRRGTKLEG